ncbi:MAG TPA: metal-dependent phosphohydrolase [Oxalobacteraceae bacterium]|jgi:putative nucleotidyltransferase with HDIG domain|nr:metal-dependent phosphohydrolase [Oxalobacteraceae bacterium]
MANNSNITMGELRVGMYVYLDLKWFEHPFAFSHFKIKTEEQIKIIRSLGLKTIRYNPDLSDVTPPRQVPQLQSPMQDVPEQPATEPMSAISPALIAKRAMIERIRQQREAAARVESAFINTANTIRDIEKNLFTKPAETVHLATQLIEQITDSILPASDLAIHVMGDKAGGEELYFHSLNVTMLSMMMARDIKLPKEVVGALGMGGLFHDIGRKEVPNQILLKKEPLTQAERHFYELHCQYGVEIGQRLQLAPTVLAIIREHHELFDGSGYPGKLKEASIGLLSRIVVIANHYDELCNPLNVVDAMTPHEALALMFAKRRSKFDPKLLQVFIRCLGVYPPGTVVQLSNGVIGMIATVNTSCPTKPMIIVYDADIPKDEAILVDMARETDVNIVKALRPAQVPREVYHYLSPRKRVSYYFDASKQVQETVAR